MNIAVALLAAARAWKDNIAIAWPNRPFTTYGELAARSGAIARVLAERGLVAGDRVALAMSNVPEYVEIFLGVWTAGLCAVPLNPRLHEREFAYAIKDSGAKLCFTTADIALDLTGAACDVIEVGSDRYRRLLEGEGLSPVERAADDLAWLFYTSGTTGQPKGAMLTHRNIMAFIVSMLADGSAMVHDNVLHIAPLSHGSGFMSLAYLMRGRTNVVLPQGTLNQASIAAALEHYAPLSFFAVPTLVNKLMDGIVRPEQIGGVHMIYFGGAPMYVDDLKRAIGFFGSGRLWHLYGQGESPMTITYLPPWLRGAPESQAYEARLASVGIARSGVVVRVIRDDGSECAAGEIGEVVVKGDVVMAGYWSQPDATAAAIRDGWLLTGDLGALDEAGYLTLHDRSKDMIISGGSNVYPREIEEVLLTCPGVLECAVVGLRDAKWGEVPVAFVVAVLGTTLEPSVLDTHCLAHLARFKRPRRYHFVPELPKNGYGKVLKTTLRKIAETG